MVSSLRRPLVPSILLLLSFALLSSPVSGVRKVPVSVVEQHGPTATQLMEAAEVAYR
jgi:hypothetical protein